MTAKRGKIKKFFKTEVPLIYPRVNEIFSQKDIFTLPNLKQTKVVLKVPVCGVAR